MSSEKVPNESILKLDCKIKSENAAFRISIVAFSEDQATQEESPRECVAHVKIYDEETDEVIYYDRGLLKSLQVPSEPMVMSVRAGQIERDGIDFIDLITLYKGRNNQIKGKVYPVNESIKVAEAYRSQAHQAHLEQIKKIRESMGTRIVGKVDEDLTSIHIAETIHNTPNIETMVAAAKGIDMDYD